MKQMMFAAGVLSVVGAGVSAAEPVTENRRSAAAVSASPGVAVAQLGTDAAAPQSEPAQPTNPDPRTPPSAAGDPDARKEPVQLDSVTVKAKGPRRDTALGKERNSAAVLDAISAEDIISAGDSDASQAMRRVTGVAVQNDVLVVRGLGDRYSSTLINGAELPSPNPSRRVISLDLFPTDLLGSLSVQKTYTPSLGGDFSGGVALIETRSIPSELSGRLKLSLGGNTQTTGKRVLSYRASDFDYSGYDDGFRDIPSIASGFTDGGRQPLSTLSSDQRGAIVGSLKNVWDPRVLGYAPPDFDGSVRIGDRYTGWSVAKIGYQISALYNQQFRYRDELRNVLRPEGDRVGINDTETLKRSEQSFDTGGVFDVGAEFDKFNKVELVSLLSRNSSKGSFYGQATDVENQLDQRRITLDWTESQLFSNQLTGSNRFDALHNLGLKWQATYSTASRDTLDRRTYVYSRNANAGSSGNEGGDDYYRLAFGRANEGTEPRRLWEFLDDKTLDLGTDFKLPLQLTDELSTDVDFGWRLTRRTRDFDSVRWGYVATGQRSEAFETARVLPTAEAILVPAFYGPGGFDLINVNSLIAQGGNANVYTARQDVDAGYAMLDLFGGNRYEVQLGARYETSLIDVTTGDPSQGQTLNSQLDNGNLLPALNATWFASPRQQVRFGASQTVNRPQFRELTPVEFLDPDTRFLTAGNPNLKQAEIVNLDARYEFYYGRNEALSVGLFYKDFDQPIEVALRSTSGGAPLRSFANAQSASDYGIEFDGRWELDEYAGLDSRWSALKHLYVAGNVSLVQSQVDVANGDPRRLQGQSPWLVNTTLGYSNTRSKTDIALLFNMFGRRIAEVGFDGLPNAEEKTYPLLDLNIRQNLWRGLLIGIKARNLLNPRIEVVQGSQVQRGYRLGTSGEFSIQYQF